MQVNRLRRVPITQCLQDDSSGSSNTSSNSSNRSSNSRSSNSSINSSSNNSSNSETEAAIVATVVAVVAQNEQQQQQCNTSRNSATEIATEVVAVVVTVQHKQKSATEVAAVVATVVATVRQRQLLLLSLVTIYIRKMNKAGMCLEVSDCGQVEGLSRHFHECLRRTTKRPNQGKSLGQDSNRNISDYKFRALLLHNRFWLLLLLLLLLFRQFSFISYDIMRFFSVLHCPTDF